VDLDRTLFVQPMPDQIPLLDRCRRLHSACEVNQITRGLERLEFGSGARYRFASLLTHEVKE